MILVIDNYDSFVHNLARYIQRLDHNCQIHRNDKITIKDIENQKPKAIIISPGPCTPKEAGISVELIQKLGAHTPILGVCLGHQAIGEAYGGATAHAQKPMHGKKSRITHNESTLFKGIPNPLEAGRYHSLISTLPERTDLQITATSAENEIMAMQHRSHPVYGVQFHPESILTPHGLDIINNFLHIANSWHTKKDKHK